VILVYNEIRPCKSKAYEKIQTKRAKEKKLKV